MTEGLKVENAKPMCVRIWLEVGHACEPRRSALGRALALDWRVWVRGTAGQDISTFVHKVVFHLHPPSAFVYPKRVIQEPPYEIQESGCASIQIPIHVYLKNSDRPKKICLKYSLQVENSTRSSTESRCVYYDIENPSEQLWKSLMKSGGEAVGRAQRYHQHSDRLLVVLSDSKQPDNDVFHDMKSKKYKFIEPVQLKHRTKKCIKPYTLDDSCPKCGNATNMDLKKMLRSVSMTEDEINRVSQLYLSYSHYDKESDSLKLPPLTDPIYRMPELPASLSGALMSVEANYAMQ